MKYVYHSPEKDRTLTANADPDPETGKVDLYDESGQLDIGKCTIGDKVGQCSPVKEKAEKKAEKETK